MGKSKNIMLDSQWKNWNHQFRIQARDLEYILLIFREITHWVYPSIFRMAWRTKIDDWWLRCHDILEEYDEVIRRERMIFLSANFYIIFKIKTIPQIVIEVEDLK